jgi:hypothetical protein
LNWKIFMKTDNWTWLAIICNWKDRKGTQI